MYKTIVVRKTYLTILIALNFVTIATHSDAQEIIIGREDAWGAVSEARNVVFTEGRRGFLDAVLADDEYTVGAETDLLLHFNADPVRDSAGRYAPAATSAGITLDNGWFGPGAALFRGAGDSMRLHAGSDALFAPGTVWGDFSLEFWLYPANLEEGETILLWMGSRWRDGRPIGQEVRASVSNRTLKWTFANFFLPDDQGELIIELSGRRSLIPRKWHHHMVRFDSSTGLLEYVVDGLPEDVTYVSATRREDGSVYFPYIGEASAGVVQLGVGFVGFIDEMRLSRAFVTSPRLTQVSPLPGIIESDPMDLGFSGSALLSIDGQYESPGRSEVYFYYRLGTQRGRMDQEWVPFVPGEVLDPPPTGRYLQVRAELFPGAPADGRPSLSWIVVDYREDQPPSPPATVAAEAGDARVRLNWSVVPEPDVEGYLVYYGTESGRYFGTDASMGVSPIDVGDTTNVMIEGLQDGRLYYFAVAAYDASRSLSRGVMSREVTARPWSRSR